MQIITKLSWKKFCHFITDSDKKILEQIITKLVLHSVDAN